MKDINMELNCLEFVIDKDKNLKTSFFLKEKILEHLLQKENLTFQINPNPFLNNILVSVIQGGERLLLEKEKQIEIINLLDKFDKEDFYLTKDKYLLDYYKILFNKQKDLIYSFEDQIYYFKGKRMKENERKNILLFLEKFGIDLYFHKNLEEILYSIKLNPISKINFNFNETVDNNIKKILETDYNSNFFQIKNNLDKDNIISLNNSNLLKYSYFNKIIKTKYILINSLININLEYNLPTCNLKKILDNLKYDNYFETVNYQIAEKIKKFRPLINFNFESFDNVEEAICYNIYLGEKKIKGLMIENNEKYFICYENEKVEIPEDLEIQKYKNKIIFNLKELSEVEMKINFDKYKINDLVNVYNHNGILIFDDYTSKFNPVTNFHLPLDFFQNRGLYMYNLTKDVSGLLKGISEKELSFDRKKINIKEKISIEIFENIENYYNIFLNFRDEPIILSENANINNINKNWKSLIKKIWKKGYFLSDYGLQKYIETGKLEKKDIKIPEWFHFEKSDSEDWIYSIMKTL